MFSESDRKCLSAYQILQCANKGGAQAALIQVFSVA